MKRILSILTIAVFALSFGACDLLDSTPDRDTDSEIVIPDDSPSDDNSGNDNDGGNTDGDNGNNDGGDNTGDNTEGETDRSKYEQHNHTFTKGDAVYFGVYYEEQPADVANWWIELADDNFSLDDYSGGVTILFSSSSARVRLQQLVHTLSRHLIRIRSHT